MLNSKYPVMLAVAGFMLAPVNAFSAELLENPMSDTEMEEYRGTSGIFDMNMDVTGNTSSGSINGENSISDSAFNQASGVINIIQNSGNNVAIQSATQVNVTIN